MLSKNRRISKEVFKKLEKSSTLSLPTLTLRIARAPGISKISFVVSKKMGRTAVLRNKLRRKGYTAAQAIIPRMNDGFLLVFYIKKEMESISLKDLKKEIESALLRNKILSN